LAVLRNAGIRTSATILPLAVHVSQTPPPIKPSFSDGIIRILFIGRFVRSKGPVELLKAINYILALEPELKLHVNMIGNVEFSDANVVAEVKSAISELEIEYSRQIHVLFHGSSSEDIKLSILRDSDIFVLPTYHEGFCVPIVEAFASGCRVVAYENSNVPSISGGFATLVTTGDIRLLSDAISLVVKDILSSQWKTRGYGAYVATIQSYVEKFAPDKVANRFAMVLSKVLAEDTSNHDVRIDSSGVASRIRSEVFVEDVRELRDISSTIEGSQYMGSQQLNSKAQIIFNDLKAEIEKEKFDANRY
jgi:glycosyltransferase involved in cell wall biosynthesis